MASPTKVIEYMSTGLGVISTTNVGDIKDFPGVSFLEEYSLINSDNYDCSRLVDYIFKDYNRNENLQRNRDFLEKEYTWESMTERYQNLFNDVYKNIERIK